MPHTDVERYIRSETGSTTDGDRQRQIDNLLRHRASDLEIRDTVEPTEYDRGFFLPPGFMAANTSDVTVPTSNQTVARYLGVAPANLALVTIRMNVTQQLVTTTWAEIGIATSLTANLPTAVDLIPEGYTAVGTPFATTGIKDTEVAVNISRGSHVWALWGSQASTPFAVRAGIGDGINAGFVQFVVTTRPSTMGNPTTFAVTNSGAQNAWMGVIW